MLIRDRQAINDALTFRALAGKLRQRCVMDMATYL